MGASNHGYSATLLCVPRFWRYLAVFVCLTAAAIRADAPDAAAAESAPSVSVDSRRALGSPSAAVAIVEFADFQCPYCRAFHVQTFPQLQAQYIDTGKARFFYKDLPAPGHRHAAGAAVAAHCAGVQGKYWPMHELLYTEQARLGQDLYEELAAEIGLNANDFKRCMRSESARRSVIGDSNEGRRLGIKGTPSFAFGYVDGERVVILRIVAGARSLETFAQEIEALRRQVPRRAPNSS